MDETRSSYKLLDGRDKADSGDYNTANIFIVEAQTKTAVKLSMNTTLGLIAIQRNWIDGSI